MHVKLSEYEITSGEKVLLSYISKLPENSRAASIKSSWKTWLSEMYLVHLVKLHIPRAGLLV